MNKDINEIPEQHFEAKGCLIYQNVRIERASKTSSDVVRIDYCHTHNVELSRKGIEWGKHGKVDEFIRIKYGVQYPENLIEPLIKHIKRYPHGYPTSKDGCKGKTCICKKEL